jgi:hypothetical protein
MATYDMPDEARGPFPCPFSEQATQAPVPTIHQLLCEAAAALGAISLMDKDGLDLGEGSEIHDAYCQSMREQARSEIAAIQDLDLAVTLLSDRFGCRRTVADAYSMNPPSTADEQAAEATEAFTPRTTTLKGVWAHHIEERLLVFYEVPKVRQFHEDQTTEHKIDWADLFFDLTYVAAAFQLGHMFIYEVSWLGAFEFAVVALCLHDAWRFKTLHDSTFAATDVVHKLLDILYMCSVASAAVFIQSKEDMENMNTSYAFGLSLSLAVNVIVLGIEKVEIYLRSKVPSARRYVEIEFVENVLPRFAMYVAASAYSGKQLYKHRDEETTHTMDWIWCVLMLFGAHVMGVLLPLILIWAQAVPGVPSPAVIFLLLCIYPFPCLCL